MAAPATTVSPNDNDNSKKIALLSSIIDKLKKDVSKRKDAAKKSGESLLSAFFEGVEEGIVDEERNSVQNFLNNTGVPIKTLASVSVPNNSNNLINSVTNQGENNDTANEETKDDYTRKLYEYLIKGSGSSASLVGSITKSVVDAKTVSDGSHIEEKREELERHSDSTNRIIDAINEINDTLKLMGNSDRSTSDGGGLSLGGKGKGLGILGGITKSLSAAGMAAPKIIAGGAAIGLAIGFIGAGIAGATWLIGSSFPKFAEGLKSFEDVDGDKLKQVGAGMVVLGGGFAALGAGKALESFGSFIAMPFDALTNFFTGENKFDRIFSDLEAFGEYDINGTKVEQNANAVIAYGKAMSIQGLGQTSSAIGSFLEGTLGTLGSLFGAEDPMDKLKRFGELELDHDGIVRNADATIAFSGAMARLSGMQSLGGLTTVADAIGTGLGKLVGTEDVLVKLKRFGDLDLNLDGVKNTVSGINEYVSAMAKLEGLKTLQSAVSVADGLSRGLNKILSLGSQSALSAGNISGLLTEMKTFGSVGITPEETANIENNARLIPIFIRSMNRMNDGDISDAVGSMFRKFSDQTDKDVHGVLNQIKTFGSITITPKEIANIENNARAISLFSAIKVDTLGSDVAGFFGSLFSSVGDLFGGTTPQKSLTSLKEFAAVSVSPLELESIENNIAAIEMFSKFELSDNKKRTVSGILSMISGIGDLVSGKNNPMDSIRRMSRDPIDLVALQNNVDAIQKISDIEIEESKKSSLWDYLQGVGNRFADKGEELVSIKEWMKSFSEITFVDDFTNKVIALRNAVSLFYEIEFGGSGGSVGNKRKIKNFQDDLDLIASKSMKKTFMSIDDSDLPFESIINKAKAYKETLESFSLIDYSGLGKEDHSVEFEMIVKGISSSLDLMKVLSSGGVLEIGSSRIEIDDKNGLKSYLSDIDDLSEVVIKVNRLITDISSPLSSNLQPVHHQQQQLNNNDDDDNPSVAQQQRQLLNNNNNNDDDNPSIVQQQPQQQRVTNVRNDSFQSFLSVPPMAERRGSEMNKEIIDGMVYKIHIETINNEALKGLFDMVKNGGETSASASILADNRSTSSSTVVNVSAPMVSTSINQRGSSMYSSGLRSSISMNS